MVSEVKSRFPANPRFQLFQALRNNAPWLDVYFGVKPQSLMALFKKMVQLPSSTANLDGNRQSKLALR
jgi:hypothetical protein